MSARTEWKLSELADDAGVSARTVRYYVQRGLLPAPVFRGPDTAYGPEHLLRLKAIKRLQEKFLPLEQIQAELSRLSPDELRRLVEFGELVSSMPPPAHTEYVHLRPGMPVPPIFIPRRRSNAWERWELAPGLELHISDDADEATRRLAERLRERVELEKK